MQELIINENVLLPEYVPEILPGREREIKDITYNFKLALDGRKPQNLLVYGPPGTGKTAVVKYISREFEDYSNKVKIVHINCWHIGTRYGIIAEMARKIGFMAPLKGVPIDEIFIRISEIIQKKRMIVIVILDEMDKLILSGHSDVLYDLSRMNEVYNVKISLVGIINELNLITTLDPRIRSSVINSDVEFKPYTVPELKNILIERAKKAFYEFEEDAIGLAAAYGYKLNGDARISISILLNAGRIAEKNDWGILNVKSVEEAFKSKSYIMRKVEKNEIKLNKEEKKIIDILKKSEITSGELYKKLPDMNERTIRNYIKKLEETGLIELKEVVGKGKTRMIRMKDNV
jgi:archaeal cell division control protein 6